MRRPGGHDHRFDWALFALSALVASGCAGDGCTCAGPIPGGFPAEERTENAVQVRISDTGLDVLTQDPGALLDSFIGEGGFVFEVPPACAEDDNPKICCDDSGTPITPCGPIEIDIELQPGDDPRLEIDPVNGASRLDVQMRARVRTLADMPIIYDTGLFDVDCDASIDTEESGADDLLVSVPVSFVQDSTAGTTRIEVGDVDIDDFNNGDLSLSGGFDCTFADLLVFAFKGSLVSTVETVVADTLREQTCKPCSSGDVAECGPFADACTDGVCMAGTECLQELGISARLPAGSILGSISPGTLGAIDLYDVLGGYATTDDNGLSFGILGGALPGGDTSRRCGPSASPPAEAPIALTPFFQGNSRPDTGDGFDIAFGVHKRHLDELLWSAYESGFLCLNIGTRTIDLLSTDTMSLVMPSVLDLVHGQNAQMVLGLRPQSPPEIALGRGTFMDDGNGGQTIDEPLLDVTMDDLAVDFYAMIDEQFIRVMTLRADVRLPVNLDATAEGELLPVLGDLDNAFQDLRVEDSHALIEAPEQLASRFPAVLDLALPMIAGSLGPIAIPEVAGLRIRVQPNGATAVENNEFLAVFAGLEYASSSVRAERAETHARVAAVHVPDSEAFLAQPRAQRPRVELQLGGQVNGSDSALEWSIRVDRGTWSAYSSTDRLTVSRAAFWLQGRHTIEVRARRIGAPHTADPTPVVLRPIIDVTPPHVVVASPLVGARRRADVGAALHRPWLLATDNVSRGQLRARYRAVDAPDTAPDAAPWRTLEVPGEIPYAASDLLIEVTDEAGNSRRVRAPAPTLRDTPLPALTEAEPARAGGCDAGSAPADSSPWWLALIALAAVSWLRPRRRDRVPAVTAAALCTVLLCALTACSSKPKCDVSGGEVLPGPTGRYSSLAVAGDRAVVTAYDDALGDLVFIEVSPDADGEDAVARRQVIDGAPVGVEPVYNTCSYRGGVTGDGADVGAWTSVVLSAGGNRARIAYQDVDNGALLFALEGSDGWVKHEIDSGDGGVAGLHSALALDSDDVPALAYMVVGLPGPDGTRLTQLRYARANVVEPQSADDWAISVLDERTVSCGGLCSDGDACAFTSGAERCVTPTDDCAVDCAGDVCVQGACVPAIAAPVAHDLAPGAGLFANLAFLSGDRPAITYYDRQETALMLQVGGAVWTTYPLDAAPDTDTGMWSSMVVDDSDVVHVTYQDALGDRLLYTTWDSGSTGPVEVVDSGVRAGDRPHPVGASSALVIDARGQISVAYQDGMTSDLVLAIREDSSWTQYDLVTGPNLYGFFVQAKPFEQSAIISNYAYDRTSNTLGQLMISRTP